ncbi:MAG: Uma2 family endonuclease [Planctomycetes bacterium]|nr:Uma2 family endonuclease [Planctomycetota bacterium]
MSAILEYPQRHPVSAEEYLRMGEAGVFAPEARLELIEGEIIEMAPIGSPHAGRVKMLTRLFVQRAGDRAVVSVQDPVIVSERSVPQPDLALLKPRADSYTGAHPTAAEILLAVEVADTTLAFDLGTKVPLYARCGVPEVWVVDVNERVVRVYREPSASGYQTSFTAAGDQRIAAIALPEVWLEPRELFSK